MGVPVFHTFKGLIFKMLSHVQETIIQQFSSKGGDAGVELLSEVGMCVCVSRGVTILCEHLWFSQRRSCLKTFGFVYSPSPSFPVLGRLKVFKVALLEVFREAHAQSVGMNRLTESINRDKEEPFSSAEIQAALGKMQDDNQVMVSEGIIFLI